ncbi:nickel ABC transporter ATP-binding protein NikE [Actinomadura rayongensis]|uniref:Nickel ABC transporter ATP-binding protein NikE n=1 Tax=Actinomadura rayongensis TaxID=1429076 RepID=A0A6I4WD17_9ACTN|nr:nickel ABC transporter ATP-binding protein NikE [Actinomadura rayongensis]MXQ67531.1 nickel ABC transporter ATP-binding protein NikE [Actinomadura rayongensis]
MITVRTLRPTLLVSAGFLLVLALAAVAAPLLAPHPPDAVDIDHVLAGPSFHYPLGTDSSGRDVLSRLLYGARLSLFGALIAAVVAVVLGVVSGLVSGYLGGRVDSALTWLATFVMSLPTIIVVLAFVAAVGPGMVSTMLLLGVLVSPMMFRLIRSSVKQVRNEPYIDAARVAGLSETRILRRHVLAVVLPVVLVQTPIFFGASLLVQAAIDFLGLGEPNAASWGAMLNDASGHIYQAPWLSVWPGLAVTVTVLAVSFIGNSLRDTLDAPSAMASTSPGVRDRRRAARPVVTTAVDPRTAVLALSGLSVVHRTATGESSVLRDVSVAVRRGEVVGIIGESGSGKTQTVLAALRLLADSGRITQGTITFCGRDITGLSERDMNALRGRRIGYVSQDPMSNLDPTFRIGSQLCEPMRVHLGLSRRQARARALDLLQRVGIPRPYRVYRSFPHEISGGMAQRVLIAAAIACEPDLLIADEPTTALDASVQAEVLDVLRSLRQEKAMAVLLATHDLGVVADICDRVVVMKDGGVVEEGPSADFFARPRTPYAQALLAACKRDEPGPPALSTDGFPSLLKVRDLDVAYVRPGFGRPAFKVLREVSLDLWPGETLGLIGESGSGKTTLGRAVLGLVNPDAAADIRFAGQTLTRLSRADRRWAGRPIQAVFQDPLGSLNPAMTIESILVEPLLADGGTLDPATARRRVRELLDRVHLPADIGQRRARELSGGQRQRVSIARALVLGPKLIVCDEPVSALDATTQAQVIDLLKEIQRDTGVAYLLISHDLGVVRTLCHRVAVMAGGRIVETGDTETVIKAPSHRHTRQLLLSSLVPDPREQAARRTARLQAAEAVRTGPSR